METPVHNSDKIVLIESPIDVKTERIGATYIAPYYEVTDAGIKLHKACFFHFCKGDRNNGEVFRQKGFFTETILQLAKMYLQDNNVGHLSSEETSNAIVHITKALESLDARAQKRKAAGVQGTYQPTPEKGAGDDYPVTGYVVGQPE